MMKYKIEKFIAFQLIPFIIASVLAGCLVFGFMVLITTALGVK